MEPILSFLLKMAPYLLLVMDLRLPKKQHPVVVCLTPLHMQEVALLCPVTIMRPSTWPEIRYSVDTETAQVNYQMEVTVALL